MDRNFPIILSELRKEKGLSQKDAAQQLGISQALLSHYEKGIRECGQSFLLRVADFYDVSTDYLLGRSKNRNDVQIWGSNIFDEQEINKPTSKTMLKAAVLIVNRLRKQDSLKNSKLDVTIALGFYKLILFYTATGNLPKNWAGRAYVDGEICCNYTYLNAIDMAYYNTIHPEALDEPFSDEPIPEEVKVLVETAENFIFNHVAENMPPMPIEFTR